MKTILLATMTLATMLSFSGVSLADLYMFKSVDAKRKYPARIIGSVSMAA